MVYRLLVAHTFRRLRCAELVAALISLLFLVTTASVATAQSTRGFWNGYNAQTNVVECNNRGLQPIEVSLSLYDNSGGALGLLTQTIAARGTTHFSLNELPIADSYGTYRVTTSPSTGNDVHCFTVFYRFPSGATDKSLEYGFALPQLSPRAGSVSGVFNSMNPAGATTPVQNWLTLFNADTSPLTLRVVTFGIDGSALGERLVADIAPLERRDIALGHDIGQIVGSYRVEPVSPTAQYIAFLSRYGTSGSGGFDFAFALIPSAGSCNSGSLAASTFGNAYNWGEILNPTDQPLVLTVELTNQSGETLYTEMPTVAPHAQHHIPLHQFLGPDNVGTLRIQCPIPANGGFIAQNMYYGRLSQSPGSIAWAYATQGGTVARATDWTLAPLNSNLGAYNWQKFVSLGDAPLSLDAELRTSEGEILSAALVEAPAFGSRDLGLHDLSGMGAIGFAEYHGSISADYSTELIRVFPTTTGEIGYIINVPLPAASPSESSSSSSSVVSSSSSSNFSSSSQPSSSAGSASSISSSSAPPSSGSSSANQSSSAGASSSVGTNSSSSSLSSAAPSTSSSFGSSSSVALLPGAEPLNLVATVLGATQIRLNWLDIASNNTATRIERRLSGGAWSEYAYQADPSLTTFLDSNAQPCTTYQYRIAFYYAGQVGYGFLSNTVTATTPSATPAACPAQNSSSSSSSSASPPANQPPALVSTADTLLITSQASTSPGSSTTDVPVQIGRTFIAGEIPNYPEVLIGGVAVLTQADVKTRWPDGSVNHAILSFYIPSLPNTGTLTVTFRNQLMGNNSGFLSQSQLLNASFDFDATTTLTSSLGQSVVASARSMLQAGAFSYWLKGQIATSVIIADHSNARAFDLGFDGFLPFRPIFHATFYPAINKVRVRFIGEIANTEALEDLNYSLALALGSASPQTVYTKSNLTQICNSRWTREYWLGGTPAPIAINHNLEYLTLTNSVPNYDTGYTIPNSTLTSQYSAWNNSGTLKGIGDPGQLTVAMGTAGNRPEIGPIPGWHARWLYTGDSRMKEIALGNSELAARWPMHFREGRSGGTFDRAATSSAAGRVLSITNRPTFFSYDIGYSSGSTTNNVNDRVVPVGSCSTQGWVPDRAHQPDLFSVPYLLTGDFFYLEEMWFWASFTAANVSPGPGDDGRGPVGYYGHIGPIWGVRQLAWPLRNRALTAYFTPDGLVEKSYFTTLLYDVLAAYEGMFNLPPSTFPGYDPTVMRNYGAGAGSACRSGPGAAIIPCSPLGHFDHGSNGGIFGSSNVVSGIGVNTAYQAATPWMHYYLVVALGITERLGYPAHAVMNQASKVVLGQLTDPNYNPYLIGQYRFGTTKATQLPNGALAITPFSSWAETLTSFTPAAQTTNSFNATSQYADPNNPDQYVAIFHAATRLAFEYANDQNLAAAAAAVWDSLFVNTGHPNTAFNTGDPKWALRCNQGYC